MERVSCSALMLLTGLTGKEIAGERGTNEGPVRRRALAINRKPGLNGSSSLAAFWWARAAPGADGGDRPARDAGEGPRSRR